MQCVYMSDFIGKIFKGIVTSVMEYGVLLRYLKWCEGLVRLSEINGDTFIADVNNYCIKGFNTGEVIRLGDEVRVVVSNVDLEKKT
jgi:ribonuclease R